MPISAKNHPEDIEVLKSSLRTLLDCYEELNEEDDTLDLYNSLKKSVAERGPKLI